MAKDSLAIVHGDFGNQNLKFVVNTGKKKFDALMPHALMRLTENDWRKEQTRNRTRNSALSRGQTFALLSRVSGDMNYFKVGANALDTRSKPRLGSAKYEYDYMDTLLVATLLEAFPDGHDNIALGISYPPSEVQHVELLRSLVGGPHKVELLSGKRVKFFVRHVLAIDEPVGGVAWLNARYNVLKKQAKGDGEGALNLRPGQKVITLDVGGFIGSIGSAIVSDDGLIVAEWSSYRAINGGVITVMDKLVSELKDDFSEELRGMTPDRPMLEDALMEGGIYLSGSATPLSVKATVERSLGLIDEIETVYDVAFDGGRRHAAVILMGGGMTALYNHISGILKHNNVKLVDSLKEIHMANARGGYEVVLAKFEQDGVK